MSRKTHRFTCTLGSTASSIRSESSALSFCTRPLIIKGKTEFYLQFFIPPVSSATYQVAMLNVRATNSTVHVKTVKGAYKLSTVLLQNCTMKILRCFLKNSNTNYPIVYM